MDQWFPSKDNSVQVESELMHLTTLADGKMAVRVSGTISENERLPALMPPPPSQSQSPPAAGPSPDQSPPRRYLIGPSPSPDAQPVWHPEGQSVHKVENGLDGHRACG